MTASREPVVAIEGLCHSFGVGEARKQVLYDNELSIGKGEIVIMTGPSGSGKTTLLTLIGTLRSVQQGSLRVLGYQLNGMVPSAFHQVRKNIGFIFQAHNLFDSLTALQNVRMATELVGMANRDARPRIVELLGRLGLQQRANYHPRSLSGGQKQRVAIARGLVHQPRIVLADEPTAALDEASGRQVVNLFRELASEQGCTIMIVTHDNRILDVADRIVNMVDGRIKRDADVQRTTAICDFLNATRLFRDLTPRTLTELADRVRVADYAPGQLIIRQGDEGQEFFMIASGSVDVTRPGDDRVTTLQPGAYFGEVALLEDRPRNANVAARQETTCYVLSKDDFKRVIATSDSFEDELRKALFERQ